MSSIDALGLTPHQLANARGIIRAAKIRGLGQQAAIIATETTLTESGMRILASANVPESQRYPHYLLGWTDDGMGHDHASCGMYQQQTGYAWTPAGYGWDMNQTTMDSPDGWGTPAELMDPEKSTEKFFDALAARSDWRHKPRWCAAQDVQGSAYDGNPRGANNWSSVYGGNYLMQDERAQQIVAALWPTTSPDWLEELMGLYDPNAKLTPAQVAERNNFESRMSALIWGEVRKPFLNDAGQPKRIRWFFRALVPGARMSDGSVTVTVKTGAKK